MADTVSTLNGPPNLKAGNSKQIEQVFLDHYEMVFRTAFRTTGNATDAEDVLQTLFMRLVRNTPADVGTGWPAYLRRAAINVSLDLIRSRSRRVSATAMEPWIPAGDPSPQREVESAELGESLRAALGAMNPKWAEMFLLRHVEGHTNREVAAITGTSAGTVAVTLFRARRVLQKSMARFRGGDDEKAT